MKRKKIPYRNFYVTSILIMLGITFINGYAFYSQKDIANKVNNMGYVIDRAMANCEFNGQMMYHIDLDVMNQQAIASCLGNCEFNGSDFNCDEMPSFLVKMIDGKVLISADVK